MEEKKVWGIHSGIDYFFLKNNVIAVGWNELGDLSKVSHNREEFKKYYASIYKNDSKQSVANCVGQLLRFADEISIGDYVVYSCKTDKKIYIGVIEGEYYFDSSENYYHNRKVKWLKKELSRSLFSQGALYELGASISVFQIRNYYDDFLRVLDGDFKPTKAIDEIDTTIENTSAMVVDNTNAYVLKELKHHYKGYDLEEVVEQLLKAMGYKTQRSPRGGDRGLDIIAYKDELPPRIMVQVKSQDSDIPESLVQSLKGAMKTGDYGLFVALSNYTKNAKLYLEENPIIKGIDDEEFVELILKYYELMSDDFKNKIPLKRVYLPVK